ncbi:MULTISPECIES: 2-hydroxychromene-2-carboxylate isomerase [unclassified Bosea (in: a-proteobacteria)]|uniref:2-hydroxychromene-2-carboxylate isomerase n=1 Tax=unclassified Bosea (in: a-proteobacteria) TaxID=2653178 RepID=UPI000954E36E|nr:MULTISPECIES: 2-hydroxychromene-2-carboxylate isomerase [unclassified Bosea (in: a-proteobacteria)]TAJ27912.1 MAG: 2-hydroxychromene-2-carboxylate isomerase [Bosea sp. (in: a-proteobacteria)]SIR30863.1 2-hydroxychromene-2-carboxylate isomerase [Bosea sp. TND4EK4]
MPNRPVLDFWYEFASPYSFLSAMRIEALAEEADVSLRWRPFLLGPIFAAQGMTTSPFVLYPSKGRYLWRDTGRRARRQGITMMKPENFPQNSLAAARLALAGRDEGWTPAFSKALFRAQFCEGRNIADEPVLSSALKLAGAEPNTAIPLARSEDIKGRLKAEIEYAKSIGIFGAPFFVTEDNEPFWGDDRLEEALDWARNGR